MTDETVADDAVEPSAPEESDTGLTSPEDDGVNPNPLGVDIDRTSAEVSDLGQVTYKARNLMVLVTLPQYLKDKDHPERGEDHSLALQMLDHDIREAMVLGARRLNDNAMKYSVTGWDWDLDTIEYDIVAPRTLSATMRLTRG